jgi:hypothetical protein
MKIPDEITFFSTVQGNVLIRLILAHLLSDFLFQTKTMVANKKWLSKYMLGHITLVFAFTALLGWNLSIAAIIAVFHWLIDGLKQEAQKRKYWSETALFLGDQFLHIGIITLVWAIFSGICGPLLHAVCSPFTHYQISLILLGYVLVSTPIGFLIKHATANLHMGSEGNISQGGKLIGIFERMIILTFVLLGQYSAIGFLITGKSILRYAGKEDDHLRSEYILVGTMMSYSLCIIVGALINWLLSL